MSRTDWILECDRVPSDFVRVFPQRFHQQHFLSSNFELSTGTRGRLLSIEPRFLIPQPPNLAMKRLKTVKQFPSTPICELSVPPIQTLAYILGREGGEGGGLLPEKTADRLVVFLFILFFIAS